MSPMMMLPTMNQNPFLEELEERLRDPKARAALFSKSSLDKPSHTPQTERDSKYDSIRVQQGIPAM